MSEQGSSGDVFFNEQGIRVKRCSICAQEFPLTEEHFARADPLKGGNRFGFYPQCRSCKQRYRREASQRRRENPEQHEKQKAAQRRYAVRHTEERARRARHLKEAQGWCRNAGGGGEVGYAFGTMPWGNADWIAEVLPAEEWQSGVGRLMVASRDFPERAMLLILLASVTQAELQSIQVACEELGIHTWVSFPIEEAASEQSSHAEKQIEQLRAILSSGLE